MTRRGATAMPSTAMPSTAFPPAASSTEQLGEQIAEIAAHVTAATFRLLELLRDFDRREGWEGFRSCAHWLGWRIGIDVGAARERVRVARALENLPLISGAMRGGEVSYSKVRAMTRVATPETEDQLLMIARHGTARHVERLVRAWRRCNRLEELERVNAQHLQRSLQVHHEDGMLVLRARLDPEVGAIVVRALEAAEAELYRRRDDDGARAVDDDSYEQVRADALALVAEAALGNGIEGAHRTADHYQVVVHVEGGEGSLDDALCSLGDATSSLEDGGHVSAETSRRIACDASIVPMVVDAAGETLSVGRKTRSIPPAIRRALDRRDDGCQFPGCGCRRCDAHHIHHWADGGETRIENLVKLCRRHHRAVHEEGYSVRRLADGELVFRRPDGRPLPAAPALPWLPADPVAALALTHRRAGIEIAADAIETWNGDRFEMGPTVEYLVEMAAQARVGRGNQARVSAETSHGAGGDVGAGRSLLVS